MNRSGLVDKLANRLVFIKNQDVKEGLTLICDKLISSLQEKKRIEVRGFGSFSARKRSPRMGRNPKTGTSISIEPKYLIYFRASKTINQDLNKRS